MKSIALGDTYVRMRWIDWCGNGVHAVLLQSTFHGQQISVWHVPSGMKRVCLDCFTMTMLDDEHSSAEMYVSPELDRVLVPLSLTSLRMCSLPSLEQTASFAGPNAAPSILLNMGWAANGSLIAVVWHTDDCQWAVTVHSGFDGSLYRTIYLGEPGKHEIFKAFAACPDQPMAAVAWWSGDTHVVLLDLDAGTILGLQQDAEPATGCRGGACFIYSGDRLLLGAKGKAFGGATVRGRF